MMTTEEMRRWFDRPWSPWLFALPRGVSGIYCLAAWRGGMWRVYYVGKASSMRSRVEGHYRDGSTACLDWIDDATIHGGTRAIWTRAVPDDAERAKAEIVAIRNLRPYCNIRHATDVDVPDEIWRLRMSRRTEHAVSLAEQRYWHDRVEF